MKLTKLAALFFLPLALFAQVNVQKQQGTNALTNGSIVVPSGMSISATGTGTIIATNTLEYFQNKIQQEIILFISIACGFFCFFSQL